MIVSAKVERTARTRDGVAAAAAHHLADHGEGPLDIVGAGVGAADPKAITYAAHQRVFEDMATAVASGRSPAVSGAEARKSVELILAIYQSALAGGAPVTLPLARTPGLHAFDQADTRRLESSPR